MKKPFRLLIAGVPALAAIAFATPAHADTQCPGLVTAIGGDTSCEFASSVGRAYRESGAGGGVVSLVVYSPVTNRSYNMTCINIHPAYCSGGDHNSAEVAVY
jgi:hypothetical protein